MNQDQEINPLLQADPPTDPEHLAKQRATPEEMLHVGRQLLKTNDYLQASKCFAKSVMAFQFLVKNQLMTRDQTVDMFRAVILPAQSNLALCYLKIGSYDTLVNLCNEIIGHNPHNVKAYYRRGVGRFHIKQFDEAIQDFKQVIAKDNQMAEECQTWIIACDREKAHEKQKMKKMASNFIDQYGAERKSQQKVQQQEQKNEKKQQKQAVLEEKKEGKNASWIQRIQKWIRETCPRLLGSPVIINKQQ